MGLEHKLATSGKLLPKGTATAKVLLASGDGVLLCYGTTMPADASTGYAPGCLFIHVDGTAGNCLYCNEGTAASSDFDAVTVG
jgi:hypothetical protein